MRLSAWVFAPLSFSPDGLCAFVFPFLYKLKEELDILHTRCFDFVDTAHIHTRQSIFESILFFDVAIAGLGHY